jgi:F-type H+-transporting ATPase subunit epsilon
MPMPLHFELVTPEKLIRSDEVHSVVVPGAEGEFTVLEGHAPFMSVVRSGELQILASAGGVPERVQVEGGFAEVNERGLTVLAEAAGPVA